MFRDLEITPEEEEEIIKKAAEKIHQYGMNVAAILMLESFKPLFYIGGQMGRVFVFPFLPVLGDNIEREGEKFFRIFEQRENVEKLILLLEKMEEKPKEERATQKEDSPQKKGWRRFLPF